MANTRRMTRKLNNDRSASWSDLDRDLLLLILMRLGLFDFAAFSIVCKSWRSLAVSNWNKFMMSKQPMYLSISSRLNEKQCYLEDYKRRKLRITIPHSNGRVCVGITCGYFIFFGREACDFWLVNPFTRKELHFQGFPFGVIPFPKYLRCILVFSPSMSGWVFVVTHISVKKIAFSLPGEQSGWYDVASPHGIHDIHFFNGKIYTMDFKNQLCELRLSPEPTLTRLEMKDFPWANKYKLEFVSSSDNLFLVDASGDAFEAFEADFREMKWVNAKRTLGEYAVFLSNFKCAAAIRPDTWAHPWTQYESFNVSDEYINFIAWRMRLTSNMWYFPNDCLIGNDADMENGALLNVMEY